MQARLFKLKLTTQQTYEAETSPTVFEQTQVEPKKNLLCKKTFRSFKSPLKLPFSN